MKRRALLLALPQAIAGTLESPDEWAELARVWNPFAAKLNGGVFDVKLWRRVADQVAHIDGRKCR